MKRFKSCEWEETVGCLDEVEDELGPEWWEVF